MQVWENGGMKTDAIKAMKGVAREIEVIVKLNGHEWHKFWWKKMSTAQFLKLADNIETLTDKIHYKIP